MVGRDVDVAGSAESVLSRLRGFSSLPPTRLQLLPLRVRLILLCKIVRVGGDYMRGITNLGFGVVLDEVLVQPAVTPEHLRSFS